MFILKEFTFSNGTIQIFDTYAHVNLKMNGTFSFRLSEVTGIYKTHPNEVIGRYLYVMVGDFRAPRKYSATDFKEHLTCFTGTEKELQELYDYLHEVVYQ